MQNEGTVPMIVSCEQASRLSGRCVKIEGHRGDGKTETAVRHVVELLNNRVSPFDILVVTATDEAATSFANRLTAMSKEAGNVRVYSAFSLAALLACGVPCVADKPMAIATAAQCNFLLIDALTVLRESESGVFEVSEEAATELASKMARASGLVLPDEVYECASERLDARLAPKIAQSAEYVIVDDWDLLCPGARRLCEKLARQHLFVVGGPGIQFSFNDECVRAFLDELRDGSSRIRSFVRCVDEGDCLSYDNALRARAFAPDDRSVRIVKWRTVQAELEGVASLVRTILDRHPDFSLSDVCIVVPNLAWARAIRASLRVLKMEGTESLEVDPLAADPRKAPAVGALGAYVRLNLLAHPESSLSWRMWLGLGHRDLAAHAWLEFSRWRAAEKLDFEAAREHLCSDQNIFFDGADKLRASFVEAEAFVRRSNMLRGLSLLSYVCPDGDVAFMKMTLGVDEREDAATLCARVSANARFQRFDDAPGFVRICSASHMAGLKFGAVIIVGAVDGLLPVSCDEEAPSTTICAESERQCTLFCDAAAKANSELVISLFQKAPEEMALDFGMRFVRTKQENGRCVAMLRPSPFIGRAGNAAPGAESAEQFIALR